MRGWRAATRSGWTICLSATPVAPRSASPTETLAPSKSQSSCDRAQDDDLSAPPAHRVSQRRAYDPSMPTTLDGRLVVAISSRALFDFEEENRVFEGNDDRAYMQLQLERIDVPARPGVAFSLVQKL